MMTLALLTLLNLLHVLLQSGECLLGTCQIT